MVTFKETITIITQSMRKHYDFTGKRLFATGFCMIGGINETLKYFTQRASQLIWKSNQSRDIYMIVTNFVNFNNQYLRYFCLKVTPDV